MLQLIFQSDLNYAFKCANLFKHANKQNALIRINTGKSQHLAVVWPHSSSFLVTNSHIKLSFAVVVLCWGQKTGEGRLIVARFHALQTWNTTNRKRSDARSYQAAAARCELGITDDVEDYGNAAVRNTPQILCCCIRRKTILQETYRKSTDTY